MKLSSDKEYDEQLDYTNLIDGRYSSVWKLISFCYFFTSIWEQVLTVNINHTQWRFSELPDLNHILFWDSNMSIIMAVTEI